MKTQQEVGENQQEVGWFQVSLRRLLKCPNKRSEVNQPWGWKEIMPENPAKHKSSGLKRLVFYNLCIDML